MEVITSSDQLRHRSNHPISSLYNVKQKFQALSNNSEIPTTAFPVVHESRSSTVNIRHISTPFTYSQPTSSTLTTTKAAAETLSSFSSSPLPVNTFPPNSSSQPTSYPVNEPDCLVILDICTSGRQHDETGSDEYPIILLTARIHNLKQFDQNEAKFQLFVKPCQVIYDDFKDLGTSRTKRPYVKLEAHENSAQHDDISTTDVTMDSTVNAINDNMRMIEPTDECIAVTGVNDQILADSPLLETALKQFDQWIEENNLYCFKNDHSTWSWKAQETNSESHCPDQLSPTNTTTASTTTTKMDCDENLRSFILLVDGPYGLRLSLHPETTVKSIALTEYPYFYQFIDIKKSFTKFYGLNSIPKTTDEMLKYLQIDDEYLPPFLNHHFTESFFLPPQNDKSDCLLACETSSSHYECQYSSQHAEKPETTSSSQRGQPNFAITSESDDEDKNYVETNYKSTEPGYWPNQHCQVLIKLVRKMTSDGMKWGDFEKINRDYYPAIIRKSDDISDNVVVRARGLPWQATDLEIFQFFSGINIAKGGISLVLSKIGRRNGEALIQFADSEQQGLALRKHKHHVGKRYIEVYAATGHDFVSVAGGETEEAEKFLGKLTTPNQTLIRMRGLPYTTTSEQILTFFANTNCSVQFGADGILFVNRRDGRATGDAFVIFETKQIAEKALENNKQHIGNRYIELFKSTPAEVNQVMNGILNPTCEEQVHYWNSLTESTNSIFNTIGTAYIPPFNEASGLLCPNYNLKLLTGQPNISDLTFSPHIFPLNSHSPYISELSHSNLSQNGNLCVQRLLPNTSTNNLPAATLTSDPLINFSSLDFLNNFSGGINTTASNILPTSQRATDYHRPITLHSSSHLGPTLVLPRYPISPLPVTNSVSSISATDNMNNHLLIPDANNLQLLQIYGPNGTNAVMPTTPAVTSTTASSNNNNINSNSNNNSINNLGLLTNFPNFGLSVEQIAKRFVRICGMPVNADITDILVFLQENWRNVAIHGIHLVYDVTGQPIGEAMIQFVSELSAQNVCEQKHGSVFIKYGLPIPITTRVDVIQCTVEDLSQLISNMSRNSAVGGSLSNLTSSTSSSLINPLAFAPLHTLDESTAIHGVYDCIPQTVPLTSQTGFGITRSNLLRIRSPDINWTPYLNIRELNNFDVPPPPLPNSSSNLTGPNNTFSLPTPFINNITNALVQCTPSLSNILGFHIPNLFYQTTIPNIYTNNSLNFESAGMLSSQISYSTGSNDINSNSSNSKSLPESKSSSNWTNSWSNNPIEGVDLMNIPDIHMYKPNDVIPSKTENKVLTVNIKGLPKDMSISDFTNWLEEKIKNLKIMSIHFEHSLSELSSGNAKLYLQSSSDAELIVQEFNNTIINNFQISAEIN
uniref:RRM domain-containing protein n=1 Tax=Trichobilharzia regenti TaxID=157069 RepID=A0AA85JH64_TRIRE|nr:unnamed protein product [Trichobilharzia regenti]